jgi:HEAT repeat protein
MTFEELIDTFQNHSDSGKRRQAVEDLIRNDVYDNNSIKAFANGLMDSDVGIRDVCQRALLNTPEHLRAVTSSSVAPFINSDEIILRNLVGEILNKMGDPCVPILLPYLKSPDFDVRKFACDILGLIGNEVIVPDVTELLNDPDKNVLLSAIETLGNLRVTSALDSLVMVYENYEITNTFDEVKPFIIEAIGKIGGTIADSYLIEQFKKETNNFLKTTIIDALSYNTNDINVSYRLLEMMGTCDTAAMQEIMLMTAFAISFRLGKNLIMPENLRYVSYKGMSENNVDVMIASVISLGQSYREEDIPHLIKAIANNNNDVNTQILLILITNTPTEVLMSFFESYFS